jgi:hypothetical protein
LKRGRPRKAEGQRLSVSLDFRVTPDEADRVHVAAIRQRKSVAKLLRDALWEVFADPVVAAQAAREAPAWRMRGRYFETCSCDAACPCFGSRMQATPTNGHCTFAMAYRIDRGHFGGAELDGLGFVVVGFAPEAMANGNWSVGIIADQRADAAQREALLAIASGSAGGPMSAFSGLISTFLGVEWATIHFEDKGVCWLVRAAGLLDIAAVAADTTQPAAPDRLRPDRGSGSHVHAFGLEWDDLTGTNHGQYAPFSWHSA